MILIILFFRNQKGGENEKWGRLTSHADGVLVLCFYDAEFVSSCKCVTNSIPCFFSGKKVHFGMSPFEMQKGIYSK